MYNKFRLSIFRFILVALSMFSIVQIIGFFPSPPLKAHFSYSTAIYDEQGNLLRLTTSKDEKYRLWIPLDQISPKLIDTVLFQEDEWFYWHFGINPYGLIRGAWQTYVLKNSPQGGSTITMQLARLLWQIDSRSISGKLEQILRAIQLELQYSKNDILEAYFNFAPYGRNIEGVGAASLIYFNKTNLQINLAEIMTLSILPKNPNSYIRQHSQNLNDTLFNARNTLYQRWLKTHPEDRKWQTDFQLNYPLRPLEKLPFFAPHFSEQLLQQYPNRQYIHSTLNSNLQHLIERVTQRYLSQQAKKGIQNVSVLLVDNHTMEVKALIGSGDYFNDSISGKINGTIAKRSYGSLLKPFIYALAFEQGLAHPNTVLKDLPTIFNDYQPENYEGNFLGPVNVTQALIQSRNIPAINIATKLKYPDLYDFLQQNQITLAKSKEHYGLSLVLGGTELNSQQLATLYAMLANQGRFSPLKWLKNSENTMTKQLISPESTTMIHHILRQNRRPDIHHKSIQHRLPVYWKTGTSNGLRDAWTAGYFGHYTLIVWLGNFNNKNNPHFIGRSLAAPLFLMLADNIIATEPKMTDLAIDSNLNLKEISVCAADGNLPNQYCSQQVKTLFIPGKSPIAISQIYQPFNVIKGSDLIACPPYEAEQTEQKIYEMWSTDFQQIFAQAGIAKRVPIVNPACPYVQQKRGLQQLYIHKPKITSPLMDRQYHLVNNDNGNRIPLTATAAANTHKLYWFINNTYLGDSAPNQPLLWKPKISGRYRISVTDDQGRSAMVEIFIRIKS